MQYNTLLSVEDNEINNKINYSPLFKTIKIETNFESQ